MKRRNRSSILWGTKMESRHELTPLMGKFPVDFQLYAPFEFDEGPVLIEPREYVEILKKSIQRICGSSE